MEKVMLILLSLTREGKNLPGHHFCLDPVNLKEAVGVKLCPVNLKEAVGVKLCLLSLEYPLNCSETFG